MKALPKSLQKGEMEGREGKETKQTLNPSLGEATEAKGYDQEEY